MVEARGERAAMGGYKAQYIEFAQKVYDCMLNESLVEIRVADSEENVGKLDDICYVTKAEVHAYQIKWTINNSTFGYSDFEGLLPKVADGLIAVDEKICDMLKMPYYINYSQSMYVTIAEDKPNVFVKKVEVAFTAQNPYGDKKPIQMNIGMGNNLSFEDEDVSVEKAKELFKLNGYKISFDDEDKEWDIRPYIQLGVKKSKIEGLEYNGIVVMTPCDGSVSPLSYDIIKVQKPKENRSDYRLIEGVDDPKLILEFTGKIHVKFEYEVRVPFDDNVFTKRLKYPARNFHLDYAVDDKISDISLVGQMIGTIIDQKNVIINILPNGKQITLNTHDWLLPKNGAVVIHGKKQNNNNK